ncbi:MAG: hypothetical protein AAGA67_13010, partial [Cyanobacteria bacterium P01_F01_bin.153]
MARKKSTKAAVVAVAEASTSPIEQASVDEAAQETMPPIPEIVDLEEDGDDLRLDEILDGVAPPTKDPLSPVIESLDLIGQSQRLFLDELRRIQERLHSVAPFKWSYDYLNNKVLLRAIGENDLCRVSVSFGAELGQGVAKASMLGLVPSDEEQATQFFTLMLEMLDLYPSPGNEWIIGGMPMVRNARDLAVAIAESAGEVLERNTTQSLRIGEFQLNLSLDP